MKKYAILLILILAALGAYFMLVPKENVPVSEIAPEAAEDLVPRHFDILLQAHNGHVQAVSKLVVEYALVSAEKAADIVGVLPFRLEVKMNKKEAAHFKDSLDKAGATSEIMEIKAQAAGNVANGPFKDSAYVEAPAKE